jgi:cytochrome c oxidase subunit II
LRDRTATRVATRRRTRVTTVLVLALALLAGACSGDQSALDPAGPYAQEPHDLIRIVFLIALVVFVFVQGLLIFSVVKFRQRKDDDGSLPVQVHGNTRLEIFWTVIPALILAAIAVPTVQGIFSQMAEPDDPQTLTVEVVGHRWWWEFHYPDYDIYTANELVIPVGVPVRLEMTAADPARSPERGVVHSFWLPRLAGKQDVVPGQLTYLNLQADEPGYYLGQCAEYCGLSHVNMRNRARALEPAEFDAWVDNQMQPANMPDEGSLEAQGAELFGSLGDGRQSCVACHAIWDGDGARSPSVGPDLTHFMTRDEFAGAIVDTNEENLREWLADPNSVKPMQAETGIGMPNLNLSDEEIDALVAYLMSLD